MNYKELQAPTVVLPSYICPLPPLPKDSVTYDNNESDIQISWHIISLIEQNKMMYVKLTDIDERGFKEYVTNGFEGGSKSINIRNLARIGKSISVGCADFVSLYNLYNVNNECIGKYIVIEIKTRNENRILHLSTDDIISRSKKVSDILGKNGVIFFDNGFKRWCDWIMHNAGNTKARACWLDYFYKEGALHHVNEQNIMLKAAEAPDILNRLGMQLNSSIRRTEFQNLTLMLYGVSAKLTTLLKHLGISGMAKLAFVHWDIQAASEELQRLFCSRGQPILPLKKGYEAILSGVGHRRINKTDSLFTRYS